MNKTITSRTKLYKENAQRFGWHVHTPAGYLGFYDQSLEQIVETRTLTVKAWRLVGIMGNVAVFEK
jgi:hypothetical protein